MKLILMFYIICFTEIGHTVNGGIGRLNIYRYGYNSMAPAAEITLTEACYQTAKYINRKCCFMFNNKTPQASWCTVYSVLIHLGKRFRRLN